MDTATRRIDVLDYEIDTGEATNRRPFVEIPTASGKPDGLTVDDEGGVWVALWDGRAVRRYTPSEELTDIVEFGPDRPTSSTFGGPDKSRQLHG